MSKLNKIKDGRYIKPYDNRMVKEIYSKLNSNIRFTFKVLEDATFNSENKAPCEITMKDIFAVQDKEKKEIMSSLTETQLRIESELLEDSINERLGGEEGFDESISKFIKIHEDKTHFVPIRYRVLCGFLQSLNIKFGNFIEILLTKIINNQKIENFEIVKDI